jgi:FixJ family two-component response regulator
MDGSDRRVFIVDASENHSALAEMIRKLSYHPVTYSTIADFLAEDFERVGDACVMAGQCIGEASGLDLQSAMLERRIAIPIIFMVDLAETRFVVTATRRGAVAVLQRPLLRADTQAALDEAFAQRFICDPSVVGASAKRLDSLTPRQRMVIQLAADGVPNKRIASLLSLSVKTVERHRRKAYARLDVHNTAEMTRLVVLGALYRVDSFRCTSCMRDL